MAFGADLELYEKPHLRFLVHSERILVFNLDISSDLFAYVESSGLDTGPDRLNMLKWE
jgi:hypothetical protein